MGTQPSPEFHRVSEDGYVVPGNVYDKYGSKNPIVRFLMNGFFHALESQLALCPEPKSILEVGCGEGELTRLVRKVKAKALHFWGSDLSAEMVSLASRSAPGVDFLTADITALPFRANAFDLVIGCEVLEHVRDPHQALRELSRIGADWFILSVPREPFWRILNLARGSYISAIGNTPGHINHWSKKSFISLIGEYLQVVSCLTPAPWTFIAARKRVLV